MVGPQSAGDRKAQIVAEMLRLADEIGSELPSTTDVARAVGPSQPTIIRHFRTKGAQWLAATETRANGPPARLKALLGAQPTAISETPALPSFLFSREGGNPALRDVFHGLLGTFQGRLVAATRDEQDTCILRHEVNPEDVAVLLKSLVQGVAILWTVGARRFPLVQEVLRLFDDQKALLKTQEDVFDGETR